MENVKNVSSQEELLQLRNEGKITEKEYKELLSEIERHPEESNKSGRYKHKIVTQILPETTFYLAEDYHQQYLEKRGLRSCRF